MNYRTTGTERQPKKASIALNSVETQLCWVDDWNGSCPWVEAIRGFAMTPATNPFSISGIVTQDEVEKARIKLDLVQSDQEDAIARRSQISRTIFSNRRRTTVTKWLLRFRKFGDDWMTRTGFLIVLVLVGSIIFLPFILSVVAGISKVAPGSSPFLLSTILFICNRLAV